MNSVSRYTPIPHLQQALYQHQSDLFLRYSKILMIRTDFHWREKNRPLSLWGYSPISDRNDPSHVTALRGLWNHWPCMGD
ncbi:hypothetical protein M2263_002149 [Providencia alcalifaciens]|nr:hypothetical protein [Providencia alcalifaciens]